MSATPPHDLLAEAAERATEDLFADMKIPVLNFLDFIQADGDELTTDSTMVALVFKKNHDSVLRSVRATIKKLPPERLGYFAETSIRRPSPNGNGFIESPAFKMTRDGFTLLAMSFTGKRAFAFKLAYLDAFNAMAKYIKNQREGLRYRCMELELKEADSKRRGSYHGKGLGERRREKVANEAEELKLKQQAQPGLDLYDPADKDPDQ